MTIETMKGDKISIMEDNSESTIMFKFSEDVITGRFKYKIKGLNYEVFNQISLLESGWVFEHGVLYHLDSTLDPNLVLAIVRRNS